MQSLFPKVSRYRKVVAIGPRHSGKSVLQASLLDHLRKAPDEMLSTQTGWQRHALEAFPGRLPPFPLEQILRDASTEGVWPEITAHASAIRFRGTDARFWKRDTVLDFIDLPGESLADFLGLGSFESWSEKVADLFPDPQDPDSMQHFQAYLDALDHQQTEIAEVAAAYSRAVTTATARGRYLATPSTYCSRIFTNHQDPANDFGPVPKRYQESRPEIFQAFQQRFQRDQQDRVQALGHLLVEADALIIPIDVGWILAGGPPLLRDQHSLLSALGDLLEQLDSFWNRIGSFLGRSFTPIDDSRFPGRLRKIILCATKIDLLHPGDRSHLEDLVRRLAEPVFRGAGLHGIEVLFTACSAVRSTTETEDGHLKGYQNGEAVEIIPPRIPEQWPDHWDPTAFRFPRLDPRISRNGLYPPAHIHLDRILRAILES